MNLIAEGGGLRGVFTAGVLDAFMEDDLFPFQRLIGISAGAINIAYYLSKSAGVFKNNITKIFLNSKFIQLNNFFSKNKEVMDLDWFFEYLKENYPLNFNEIQKFDFFVCCTNVTTGKSEQKKSKDILELYRLLQASCATPLYYTKPLLFNGIRYVDGSLSDPLPIGGFLHHNNKCTVIIRNRSDSGENHKISRFIEPLFYLKEPKLFKAAQKKHQIYESSLKLAKEKHNVIIIQPQKIKSSFAKSDSIL